MEESKAMKDYTKYDFAAIVGAEVEIELKDGSTYKGMLVADIPEQTAFCVKHHLGIVKKMCNEDILTLTAKIKVEDMSVKQLKRFIKPCRGGSEVMVIAKDGVHHSILDSCDELSYDYDEFDESFADYIDCTEWGWQK